MILWIADKITTVIAKNNAEVLKNLFERKKTSPRSPCKKTAKYAVKGVCGLTDAFIKITITQAFNISPREVENNAINEIRITANPLSNAPLKGILNACRIPPSTDSLKAQSAVSLMIADELSGDGICSKFLIILPVLI